MREKKMRMKGTEKERKGKTIEREMGKRRIEEQKKGRIGK